MSHGRALEAQGGGQDDQSRVPSWPPLPSGPSDSEGAHHGSENTAVRQLPEECGGTIWATVMAGLFAVPRGEDHLVLVVKPVLIQGPFWGGEPDEKHC